MRRRGSSRPAPAELVHPALLFVVRTERLPSAITPRQRRLDRPQAPVEMHPLSMNPAVRWVLPACGEVRAVLKRAMATERIGPSPLHPA